MELTEGEKLTMLVNSDCGDKNRCVFLEKPSGNRIKIRLFVRTVRQNQRISDSEAKNEKSGYVVGEEGECGDDALGLQERDRRRLDILSVKKEAKLSAREIPGIEEGKGEDDLRCKTLFAVCQRRLGFSEDDETRLE